MGIPRRMNECNLSSFTFSTAPRHNSVVWSDCRRNRPTSMLLLTRAAARKKKVPNRKKVGSHSSFLAFTKSVTRTTIYENDLQVHIRLGFTWSDALDLELKEGKRVCERDIGPPEKCGAFDMQKLADLSITGDPLCPEGPMRTREGTLCGCWWAMREVELSTARCMQVTFLGGPGCGRCVIDFPVTKSDPQALGKKRTHTCACSTVVGSIGSKSG